MKKPKYFVVDKTTTLEQLKDQRNTFAKKYHPDVNKDKDAEQIMSEIQAEYQDIIENWATRNAILSQTLIDALHAIRKTMADEKALDELKKNTLFVMKIAHPFIEKKLSSDWNNRLSGLQELIEKMDVNNIAKFVRGETK